jgi:hypothetical protein
MNIDKIITHLEGKQTLLIFLRDNFPNVLEKWKAHDRATIDNIDGETTGVTSSYDIQDK